MEANRITKPLKRMSPEQKAEKYEELLNDIDILTGEAPISKYMDIGTHNLLELLKQTKQYQQVLEKKILQCQYINFMMEGDLGTCSGCPNNQIESYGDCSCLLCRNCFYKWEKTEHCPSCKRKTKVHLQ